MFLDFQAFFEQEVVSVFASQQLEQVAHLADP